MKINIQKVFAGLFLCSACMFTGCEDDIPSNSNEQAIPLRTAEGSDLKAPGRGQYALEALSGDEVSVLVDIPSSSVRSLTITKTVNLEVDPTFGENGVLTVPASYGDAYTFTYAPPVSDIDQLVGFTFTAERSDGLSITSDLTLIVT